MVRRPTIIDVAQRAGVSKSTVSLVLQNSPHVREKTRKLVRKAMAEIGYVYNRTAANMRASNAGLIGLVITGATGRIGITADKTHHEARKRRASRPPNAARKYDRRQ